MSHIDTHWVLYETKDNGQLIVNGQFLTLEDTLKAIPQEVEHYGPMKIELVPIGPESELYNSDFKSFQFEAPKY